ncbi:MAG: hypothetical protein JWN69_1129 [Alphaproteobacteria bacterium]|nr:hypothetical protein [Alphaproteobacteria bacterium]
MITPLIAKEKGERRRLAGVPLFGALAIAAVVGVTAMFSEYHSIDGEFPRAQGATKADAFYLSLSYSCTVSASR